MASKNPQTMAKRARELAVKERRDRKRAKKAEAAAQPTAAADGAATSEAAVADAPHAETQYAPASISTARDLRGARSPVVSAASRRGKTLPKLAMCSVPRRTTCSAPLLSGRARRGFSRRGSWEPSICTCTLRRGCVATFGAKLRPYLTKKKRAGLPSR